MSSYKWGKERNWGIITNFSAANSFAYMCTCDDSTIEDGYNEKRKEGANLN